MANIVLIQNDPKVIREMQIFIREMSKAHFVVTLNSTDAFMKRFVKEGSSSEDHSVNTSECFKYYDDEKLKSLSELSYTNTPPFQSSFMTIETDRLFIPKKVQGDNDKSLWGNEFIKIRDNKFYFREIIHKDFLAYWEIFMKEAKEKEFSQILFPISHANKIYFIHFGSEKTKTGYLFTLTSAEPLRAKAFEDIFEERSRPKEDSSQKIRNINLVLIDALLTKDPTTWVKEAYLHLKEHGFFPESSDPSTPKATRFILTKYEEDKNDKSKLLSPLIDDFISIPLDRMLFKQKLEICLNLPGPTTPNYLYSQPVDFPIELSKRIPIEYINDLYLEIANPVPLKAGLKSVFYIQFPGDTKPVRLPCVVDSCRKHPQPQKKYLLRFNYFGLSKENKLKFKTYLKTKVGFHELLSSNPEDFEFNEENIYLTPADRRIKNVVVIEQDVEKHKSICKILDDNINHIHLIKESSFYLFDKKYLGENTPKALSKEDIFTSPIVWTVDSNNFHLSTALFDYTDDSYICGTSVASIFSGEDSWKKLFESPNNDEIEILENALKNIVRSKEEHLILQMPHIDNIPRICELQIEDLKNGLLQFRLNIPDPKNVGLESFDSIDALVINSDFIGYDIQEWINNLNTRAQNKRYLRNRDKIKVIALKDTSSNKHSINTLFESDIDMTLEFPMESKALCYHVSNFSKNSFSIFNKKNLNKIEFGYWGYIAKKVILDELSEYGATIQYEKPFKTGSTVYLHQKIYDNAPGGTMCARIYFCQEHPKNSEASQCFLTYFGINQEFLTFTRSWIREFYASKKKM